MAESYELANYIVMYNPVHK